MAQDAGISAIRNLYRFDLGATKYGGQIEGARHGSEGRRRDQRAKVVLLKAKSQATGLTAAEKAAASFSVEVLDNVISGFDKLP